MFFDRRNCRKIRDLVEVSGFLEVAIEQLEKLERETLEEIKNEKNKSQQISPITPRIKEEPIDIESTEKPSSEIPSNVNTPAPLPGLMDTLILPPPNYNCPKPGPSTEGSVKCVPISSLQCTNNLSNSKDSPVKQKIICPKTEENELDSYEMDCKDTVFSTTTATMALTFMNQNSETRLSSDNNDSCSKEIKKEPDTYEIDMNSSLKTDSAENVQKEHIRDRYSENTDIGRDSTIPECTVCQPCISVCVPEHLNPNLKAVIKFKVPFKVPLSCSELKQTLEENGITGIINMSVSDEYAIITFATNQQLQKLLKLNWPGKLKKFSATYIKKYNDNMDLDGYDRQQVGKKKIRKKRKINNKQQQMNKKKRNGDYQRKSTSLANKNQAKWQK